MLEQTLLASIKSAPAGKKSNIAVVKQIKQQFPRFCCGVNEITKKLEKNEIVAFVVSRELDQPIMLTEHLMWMAALKQIPVLPIQNSKKQLQNLFQIHSILAFGFLKGSHQPTPQEQNQNEKIFEELVTYCVQKFPKIPRPWMSRGEYPTLTEINLSGKKRIREAGDEDNE